MQYEFLKNFPKRMKNVGLYVVLTQNIAYKNQKWSRFDIEGTDRQVNLVFAVLLFLMEKSLREEPCTIDDVAVFIDNTGTSYFGLHLDFDGCLSLADFIVNTLLSNDGEQMAFQGYDFEEKQYHTVPVRYLTNQVVYLEGEVKRTSFRLTDDGYNLLLSTLEIESNMRLTVQELLFQLQMEKQDYDRAVDTIKDIFDSMRRQVQKIRDAMIRIRRNALSYSVSEYDSIVHENLDSLAETSKRFEAFRELTARRRKEIDSIRINLRELTEEEERNLKDLGIIGSYLDRVLSEHQRILNDHFELKALYTKELESLSRVAMIKRFSLREKIYEPVLKNPAALGEMGELLAPLFRNDPEKIYHPALAALPQRPLRSRTEEETTEELTFDEEAWEREQERLRQEKQRNYEACLGFLLRHTIKRGTVLLSELKALLETAPEAKKELFPSVDVFKEVMVELLKIGEFDAEKLREERKREFAESSGDFEANIMIPELLDRLEGGKRIRRFTVRRSGNGTVVFDGIPGADGTDRQIRCSEVSCSVEGVGSDGI